MRPWSQIKEDLYHGLSLVRRGMLTAAIRSAQETDRLKLRFRLQALDQELAEAYEALGKYVLGSLQSNRTEWMKGKEWVQRIQEIEAKQAEREKLVMEQETENDSGGH